MENLDLEIKDLFVSHAWGDKPTVEPIVAALEGAGISCWYDVLELTPSDSLIDGINHGLTHCKAVLFCLSEQFLKGNWTGKELNAAMSLSTMPNGKLRLLPLMLEDPQPIRSAYPLQFGDRVYIQWSGDNIDEVIDSLRKNLSEIDEVGSGYWLEEGYKSYRDDDYVKAALYSRKSISMDAKSLPQYVLHAASLWRLGRKDDVYRFIAKHSDDWPFLDEGDLDLDILDFIQDEISREVTGDESDDWGFSHSVKYFLSTKANGDRAWRYVARLFDKPEFEFHQDDIVLYAALQGKGDALDWLREKPLKSRKEKPRSSLANCAYQLAFRFPELRPELVEIARELATDESSEVRAAVLHTLYRFAPDGVSHVVNALNDRSPLLRASAFDILLGKYIDVAEDFAPSREKGTGPDPALTPEVVTRLLEDDDDLVFEAVVEAISDGEVPCPPNVDLANLTRPPTEEVREAMVKEWAREDSVESFEKICSAARHDGSDFVRREAIEALEELDRPLSDEYLRELYENETEDWARSSLESLIEEKGGASLADVYVRILGHQIDSTFSARSIFEKIATSGDVSAIRNALELCEEHGSFDCAAEHLGTLVKLDLRDESRRLVEWCLQNGEQERIALLAAGEIPEVPEDVLTRFLEDEDPNLRAAAMRALERRRSDGSGTTMLQRLYEELKPAVLEQDNNAMWASLEAIDGITEFLGPESAIPLLKEYYEVVEKLIEGGSFPLRAAWERLRILGSPVPHPVYDSADEARPYPWPSTDGPYYGIKR